MPLAPLIMYQHAQSVFLNHFVMSEMFRQCRLCHHQNYLWSLYSTRQRKNFAWDVSSLTIDYKSSSNWVALKIKPAGKRCKFEKKMCYMQGEFQFTKSWLKFYCLTPAILFIDALCEFIDITSESKSISLQRRLRIASRLRVLRCNASFAYSRALSATRWEENSKRFNSISLVIDAMQSRLFHSSNLA